MPFKSIDNIELKFEHNSKKYTLGIRNITTTGSVTGASLPAGTFYIRQGKKEIAVAWNYVIYKNSILTNLEQQQTDVVGQDLDDLVEVLVKALQ